MSLTQAEHIFGGVHETGINDLLQAFFTARPRQLNYGTPMFVAATTAAATSVPAINFFGLNIQFLIGSPIPTVDITPGGAGSAALPPGVNEFTVRTTLNCVVSAMPTVPVALAPPYGVTLRVCAPVAAVHGR